MDGPVHGASSAPCSLRAGRSGCSRPRAPCCSIAAPRPRCAPPCGRASSGSTATGRRPARLVHRPEPVLGRADRRDAVAALARALQGAVARGPEHRPRDGRGPCALRPDSAVQEQILVYDFAVKPRPPAPTPSARRQRQRCSAAASARGPSLLAVGARQFALRGIAPVSVEELIAEADVSRATFYGLFSSKYSLLDGILNPIFELATRRIRELCARPRRGGDRRARRGLLVALDDASRRAAADSARRPGNLQAFRDGSIGRCKMRCSICCSASSAPICCATAARSTR